MASATSLSLEGLASKSGYNAVFRTRQMSVEMNMIAGVPTLIESHYPKGFFLENLVDELVFCSPEGFVFFSPS